MAPARSWLALPLALSSALLLAACSSDDGSSSSSGQTGPTGGGGSSGTVSGPPAPAQGSDFFKTLAQLECQAYQPCCSAAGHAYDQAKCEASVAGTLQAFLTGSTYHQDKAQACLDTVATAISQLGGKCPEKSSSGPSTSPDNNVCGQVFSEASGGGSPPGGECKTSGDCASSNEGNVSCHTVISSGPSGTTQQRYCQVRIAGKAGDGPCDFAGSTQPGEPPAVQPKRYECSQEDGLRCDFKTNTCLPLAKVGEACSGDSSCVAEAYCGPMLTCQTRAALGEACSDVSTGGSSAPRCGADGRCDKATMTCVARLANGSPCATNADCQSDQCVNQTCEDPNASSLQLFCP